MITEVEIRNESEATIEDDVGVTYDIECEIIAHISGNQFQRFLMKEFEAPDGGEPSFLLAFVDESDKKAVYSEVLRTPEMIKEYLEGAEDEGEAFLDLFNTGMPAPTYEAKIYEPEGRPEFS
jgi:hypothetical protein